MKYFCAKCGKTTQYSFELPKFCSNCGESFSKKSTNNKIEAKRDNFLNELKFKKINNINTPNKCDENSHLNFKNVKPSFKLNIYQKESESLGQILDNPTKPLDSEKKSKNLPTNNKTDHEILEEFKKEAGALRSE